MRITEFEDGRRFRRDGSFLWMALGYDHVVTTDDAGRVSITFIVDGAGVGVNTIGRLFASWWVRITLESMLTVQSTWPAASASATSSAKILSQVPSVLNGRWRFDTVCHGPNRSGRSRHAIPAR